MKIKIIELKEKVNKYLQTIGMDEHNSGVMTNLVVEQEMIGNQFSPVGELSGKHVRLIENTKNIREEVASEKPSLKLIKGNGRPALLITADHGNIEQKINPQTGDVSTEHTNNPVPFMFIDKDFKNKKINVKLGKLADVGTTILALLGINKPEIMTGENLLK